MSLLDLSPWPAALLCAATAAVILILYLLKPPPRRLVVSSVLLWSRVVRERRRTAEKWRWWVSLLVALVVGVSLALGVGRPMLVLGPSGGAARMVVVVDNGPTMATRRSDGRTRWEHAVETARRLIESVGGAGEVVLADTAGRLDAPGFEDAGRALERLDALEVEAGDVHGFPPLDLGDAGAEVHFISDGVGIDREDIPTGTFLHSVFEPADDVAVTGLRVRRVAGSPPGVEAFVEVTSMAGKRKRVKLRVAGVGPARLEMNLFLEPGQSKGVLFDLSRFASGPLRVAVTMPGDSLDVDNLAYAVVPERRRRRVVLVSPGNPYLERYFASDESIETVRRTPEAIEQLPAAEVYVFDRCAPSQAPRKPYLVIAPPAVSWLPRVVGRLGRSRVQRWDRDHPVMQDVDLVDLVVEHAKRYETSSARVLGGVSDGPLVLSGDRGVRWLLLAFALEESNFVYQAGFPIFLSHAVAWLAGEPTSFVAGLGPLVVPGAEVRVSTWEGEPVPVESFRGQTLFRARRPGLYVAERGKERFYVASNLRVRDINRGGLTATDEAWTERKRGWRFKLWQALLVLAFILLVVEWWAYHRRWTV